MKQLHVVVPNDIDDPLSPSGGNLYDRRICRALAVAGWSVHEHAVHGGWPKPDAGARAGLARVLSALPDDSAVLVDGLIASAVPEVLASKAGRLRLVVLIHMPLLDETEREVLAIVDGVLTTSRWSRQLLLDRYRLPADRVHAAPPGVDAAPLAQGSDAGAELLCVAAVARHKGHDVLVEALASVADRPWRCLCVGTLDREPGFTEQLRDQIREYGLSDRIVFAGPQTGADLSARYGAADVLVLASRGETYGMVVTEALARGLPVLATATGGLAEALGRAPDGSRPGALVPPEDPAALAGVLRRWLDEPDLRRQLRNSALLRRKTLTDWRETARLVSIALSAASTKVSVHR